MNIKKNIFIASIILFCGAMQAQGVKLSAQPGNVQVNNTDNARTQNEWKPFMLNHDGTNVNGGVQAVYALVKCNNEDVVLLKMNNTNSFSVKAQWINQIISKDGKENFDPAKITFISLPPNTETTGDCSGNTTQLMVKLSDLGVSLNNFETFVCSNFYAAKPGKAHTK